MATKWIVELTERGRLEDVFRLDAPDARDPVEVTVEAAQGFCSHLQEHRSMECVAGGERAVRLEQSSRPVHHGDVNGEPSGHDGASEVVDTLAVVPAPDCPVAVQDLLQDLDVRGRIDCARGDTLEERDAGGFVWVLRPGGVHQDVRVEEDHVTGSSS